MCIAMGRIQTRTPGSGQIRPDFAHSGPDVHVGLDYFTTFTSVDILDLTCVKCAVGSISTRRWSIVDRTGSLRRSWYNDHRPEEDVSAED
jgi:hypothetical protein